MQIQKVSKSQFKSKALEYFRLVEQKKHTFVVTHNGNPVAQVTPYEQKGTEQILKELRTKFKLIKYDNPLEPVGLEDWEALNK